MSKTIRRHSYKDDNYEGFGECQVHFYAPADPGISTFYDSRVMTVKVIEVPFNDASVWESHMIIDFQVGSGDQAYMIQQAKELLRSASAGQVEAEIIHEDGNFSIPISYTDDTSVAKFVDALSNNSHDGVSSHPFLDKDVARDIDAMEKDRMDASLVAASVSHLTREI